MEQHIILRGLACLREVLHYFPFLVSSALSQIISRLAHVYCSSRRRRCWKHSWNQQDWRLKRFNQVVEENKVLKQKLDYQRENHQEYAKANQRLVAYQSRMESYLVEKRFDSVCVTVSHFDKWDGSQESQRTQSEAFSKVIKSLEASDGFSSSNLAGYFGLRIWVSPNQLLSWSLFSSIFHLWSSFCILNKALIWGSDYFLRWLGESNVFCRIPEYRISSMLLAPLRAFWSVFSCVETFCRISIGLCFAVANETDALSLYKYFGEGKYSTILCSRFFRNRPT